MSEQLRVFRLREAIGVFTFASLGLFALSGCGDSNADTSYLHLSPQGIEATIKLGGDLPVAPGLFVVDKHVSRFSVTTDGSVVPAENDLGLDQEDVLVRPFIVTNPHQADGEPGAFLGTYSNSQLDLYEIAVNTPDITYYEKADTDRIDSICGGDIKGIEASKVAQSGDGLTLGIDGPPIANKMPINIVDEKAIVHSLSSSYHVRDLTQNCH